MEHILTLVLIVLAAGGFAWFVSEATQDKMILSWYGRLLEKMPDWLANPLGLCSLCFSAQLGLWVYMIYYWGDYNLIEHIFVISYSAIVANRLDKWTL